MKAYALLLCLLLLVLAACGGGNDDLNADGDPLGGGDGVGITVDGDDDASAIVPSNSGDDIFGSDTENSAVPNLNENAEDGALFAEESGAGVAGD